MLNNFEFFNAQNDTVKLNENIKLLSGIEIDINTKVIQV